MQSEIGMLTIKYEISSTQGFLYVSVDQFFVVSTNIVLGVLFACRWRKRIYFYLVSSCSQPLWIYNFHIKLKLNRFSSTEVGKIKCMRLRDMLVWYMDSSLFDDKIKKYFLLRLSINYSTTWKPSLPFSSNPAGYQSNPIRANSSF